MSPITKFFVIPVLKLTYRFADWSLSPSLEEWAVNNLKDENLDKRTKKASLRFVIYFLIYAIPLWWLMKVPQELIYNIEHGGLLITFAYILILLAIPLPVAILIMINGQVGNARYAWLTFCAFFIGILGIVAMFETRGMISYDNLSELLFYFSGAYWFILPEYFENALHHLDEDETIWNAIKTFVIVSLISTLPGILFGVGNWLCDNDWSGLGIMIGLIGISPLIFIFNLWYRRR